MTSTLPPRASPSSVRLVSFLCLVFMAWNITTNQFVTRYAAVYPSEEPTHSLAQASNSNAYLDRQCLVTGSMEDRKRVRWVGFKATQVLYSTSFKVGGYYLEKAAFLVLHVVLFVLAAFFSIQSSAELIASQKPGISKADVTDWCYLVTVPVFSALTLYVFAGHSSEFTFSIIEAFCISAGLFFALRSNPLLFALTVTVAVLNRESGFILLLLWYAFNGRRGLWLPLIASAGAFLLANYDLVACFKPSFFVSASHQSGQLSLADVGDQPLSVVSSALLNFVIFVIIAFGIRRKILPLADERLRLMVNKLVGFTLLYLLVFLVSTPLHHMSIKYLLVPFLTVLTTVYFVLAIERRRAVIAGSSVDSDHFGNGLG